MQPLIERLCNGPVLRLDGAFGSVAIQRGWPKKDMPPVTINATDPKQIMGLHQEYIRAGANAVLTTTFGAVFDNLHPYLPEEITSPADVVVFNRNTALRAREAAKQIGVDNTTYVIGSMAPLTQEAAYKDMVAAYLPQAQGLFEAGVDGVVVETAFDPAMFAAAVEAHLEWLAIIGVLNSIVALYYYLVLIKIMYVDRHKDDDKVIPVTRTGRWALGITTLAVLLLGLLPTWVFDWATEAARTLFNLSV